MWMLCMGIDRMSMVVMIVTIRMIVVMVHFCSLKPTDTRAKLLTKRTVCNIRTGCKRALAFNMVVVRFLYGTNFVLKSQNLCAVFAKYACRRRRV